MMRLTVSVMLLGWGVISPAQQQTAKSFQGVITDWNCTQDMVKNGREKTLKQRHECSLDSNFSRSSYGLITDDKHYYKLDDAGRNWALKLLNGSSDKDNLHVTATGTVEGDTLHVQTMSEL